MKINFTAFEIYKSQQKQRKSHAAKHIIDNNCLSLNICPDPDFARSDFFLAELTTQKSDSIQAFYNLSQMTL